MTMPRCGYEEFLRSFLFIVHFMRMMINDPVCSGFGTHALRNAKLIFESLLHLFYRASYIRTVATLLYRFGQC